MDSIVSQTHTLELSEKPQVGPTEDEDSSMDPPENRSYTEDEDTDEDDSAECFSGKSLMGLTENLSPTFLSTGNPCLDFFFHVVPDTPAQDLIGRMELAWTHDPLITLKLICNLRGVRGTGKSDKESFYTAAFWLHNHHPKTLASNARAFANFGYFKDLLEILYRILEGPEVRKREKEERMDKRREKSRKKKFARKVRGKFRRGRKLPKEEKEEKVKIVKTVKTEEEVREERERARVLRKDTAEW